MEKVEKIAYLNDCFLSLRAQGKVKTQGDFARLLQVSQNTISAAKNGNEDYLTESLIGRIKVLMESNNMDVPEESLLVIPTGARAGTLCDFADSVMAYQCERMISPIKGADFAMQVTGDSMSPEYPSGSQIIIKRIDETAFVEWGKVYVLDTDNGAVIKQIRKTDNPNVVECVSLNPSYQPFNIDMRHIRGWYRVLMCLSLK